MLKPGGYMILHDTTTVRGLRDAFENGVLTRIARIYNRVIPDELERLAIDLPFDYRDDLDVEWTGHPEWFFRISKFSIPWLRHPSVPRTWFLHETTDLPLARSIQTIFASPSAIRLPAQSSS